MTHPTKFLSVTALLSLTVAGCENRVQLTGRVLNDGRPVPGAELSWAHQTDPTVAVSGVTNAEGTYILEAGGKKAVPVGKYHVTVTWWEMPGGEPLPAGEEGAALRGSARARQLTAEVDVDVTGASYTLDVDVSGKGRPMSGE